MGYIENRAKDFGSRGIKLWSNPAEPAVKFYKKCGYRIVGKEDVDYSGELSLCVPLMIKEFE